MAKILNTVQANRLTITGYHVDATNQVLTLEIQAQNLDGDGNVTAAYAWPSYTINLEQANTVMAAATVKLVTTVLTTLIQASAVAGLTPTIATNVVAAVGSNPTAAAGVYLQATEDALYEQL